MKRDFDASRNRSAYTASAPARRRFLAGGVAAAAGGLAGCVTSPIYVFKYKLVLNVEAGGRLHQGVNVVKNVASAADGPFRLPTEMAINQTYGEANVTDLGGGRFLVALLGNPSPLDKRYPSNWGPSEPTALLARLYGVPISSLNYDLKGVSPGSEKLDDMRGQLPIGPDDLPVLVTFRDPAQPASAVRVDPTDLAATFGPGVRLVSATLGITDDRVTRGRIKRYLPALLKPSFGYGYTPVESPFLRSGARNPRYTSPESDTTAQILNIADFTR